MAYGNGRVVAKCDLDGKILETYPSLADASIAMVGTSRINSGILIAINSDGVCYGFKWMYTDETTIMEFIPEYTSYELNLLIDIYTNKANIIWYMIHKFSFIQEHEEWDYFQEICIRLYKTFGGYLKTWKGEVHNWICSAAQQAIFNYKTKIDRYKKRTVLGDSEGFLEAVFKEYTEDDSIDRLMKAIQSLPEKDQNLLADYFNGVDLAKKATSIGQNEKYFKNRMAKIRDTIYKNRHRFFVGHFLQERERNARSLARLGKTNASQSKKIVQFDVHGTKYLGSFESTELASKLTNISRGSITRALTGRSFSAGGYVWKYAPCEN